MTTPGLGQPIDYGATGVRKRLDAIERIAPLSGARLLDVGCGNGAYTEQLAQAFGEVIAVDVVPEHLAELDRHRPPNVSTRLLSAEHLDYPDGHFDAAVMVEVIEHLSDLPGAMHQIRRTLRDGGRLAITAPNRLFPIETHLVNVGRRSFPGRYVPFLPWLPPLHGRVADARTYTARSLRHTVEPFGFRMIGVEWVMPPFDRWAAGHRFVKPVTDRVERTPMRRFGVAVVAVFEAH